MTIVVLGPNQPPGRFYRGGARIADFRGVERGPDHRPEDWVGSTTTLAGESATGLTILDGGATVRELVESDPSWWLGDAHVAAFGARTMLLVKLLDAGQRLPVHAHPDDAFSRARLGRPFGKAEAWLMLTAGTVHVGLRRDVSPKELRRLVEEQDVDELLSLLHERQVDEGDAVYVPPGELHAIGAGAFLLEVQQPEDLSILLEWRGFALDGARDGHLGLGFDAALDAVTTRARSADEVDAWILRTPTGADLLPPASRPFFRLDRIEFDGTTVVEGGFAVLVGVHGHVQVRPAVGSAVHLDRGSTVLVAHASGALTLEGAGAVLICRPPEPRGTH